MKFTGNAKSDPNTTYPEGDYYLTCTGVQHLDKYSESLKSKNGNDMWILELTVAEGEHKNRKQWHYLVWLPAGSPGHGMTLKTLKGFGINPEGDNEILPEHLLNVTVKAKVGIDASGEFDPKNVVKKWYVPEGDGKTLPASQEDPNGTAQDPTDFDPAKLEKQAAPPSKPAPAPATKKPLWGSKK